jgi:hypothetical protein
MPGEEGESGILASRQRDDFLDVPALRLHEATLRTFLEF